MNPYRYRGYYYDVETRLYYCLSRYYDPEVGRFINADDVSYIDPEIINGLNLYSYCGNNPVNYIDPDGHAFFSILLTLLIGGLIGAAIGGTFNAVGQAISGQPWDWESFGLSLAGGFVAGFIAATPLPKGLVSMGLLGKVLGYGLTFAYGGAGAVAGGLIMGSVDSWETAGLTFLIGGAANALAKGISDKIANVKASKIFNQGNKAKSLAVQKLQGSRFNMGQKVLKGAYRNTFKQASHADIVRLIVNANPWFRLGIYSAVGSSVLSGWY